jgi:tRNA (guanine-N7-)-methyltransferase
LTIQITIRKAEITMRLRNITGSREVIAESPYVVPEDTLEACPGTWHEIFGNDHPIHIEIGMGKGRFLHTLAKQNPQINYVGIEKYSRIGILIMWELKNIPAYCSARSRKWKRTSFPT